MKINILYLLSFSMLIFASCSSSDDLERKESYQIRFNSTIAENAQTRATNATWNKGDAIGIYMVGAGGFEVQDEATNIKYITSEGDGNFISDNDIFMPNDGSKVDFISYYPHTSITNYNYVVNLANQSNQSQLDLLYAKKVTGRDKNNINVELVFTHQLSKLVLNVEKGENITSLDGLKVVIKGMNTAANFNLKTGAIELPKTIANIEPLATANSFEATLLPAVLTSETVEFTLNGIVYVWRIADKIQELKAGQKYTYKITLIKSGEVNVSGSITDWTTDRDQGEAN